MHMVADFRVGEKIHADVVSGEEEQLVLAKYSGVTDAMEEDRRLDGWLSKGKEEAWKIIERRSRSLLTSLIPWIEDMFC